MINFPQRNWTDYRGKVRYSRIEISAAIKNQLAIKWYPIEQYYGDGTAGNKFADICSDLKLPKIQKTISY